MFSGKGSLIRAEGLRLAGYDPQGIDFALDAGDRVGILGAPKCGKTQLLRTLAYLEPSRSGRLFWNNVDITQKQRWLFRRHRSFVKLILSNPYTFLEPWIFAESLLKKTAPNSDIEELLKRSGLTSVARQQHIRSLSGIERVRLALAYALSSNPQVLMLDDVFCSLVPEVWETCISDLLSIINPHCALVIASQYWRVVQAMDHIVVVKDGALIEWGPREAIIKHPQHSYTQRLLELIV